MRALMMKHGARGYGIYWMIAEDLYRSNGKLARDYDALAWAYHEPQAAIQAVVENFELFYDSNGKIACKRVDQEIEARAEAIEAARRGGKKRAAQVALKSGLAIPEVGEERRGEEGKDITAAPSAADLSKELSTTVDKLCKTPIPEANLETQLPFSFGDIPKGRRVIDIDPTSCRAILDKATRLGLELRRALEARIKIKQSELHPQLRSA